MSFILNGISVAAKVGWVCVSSARRGWGGVCVRACVRVCVCAHASVQLCNCSTVASIVDRHFGGSLGGTCSTSA
jgi:hypothetical protein